MVLKKPYAFMIKHFRIIHLLLLIPIFYLIIKTRAIVNFFNSYVVTGYSLNFSPYLTDIGSHYINIFMYIAVIIILAVFIIMSIMLQQKEKPTKQYNISIVFYVLIFILITACFSFFTKVENDTIGDIFSRFIRDIGYLIYLAEYIFAILTFIRGIGFNLKKFDFKSDIDELQINSEDSEEFEFIVGKDIHNTTRTIRRFFRELKYYYLENKFIVNILVLIIILIIGTYLFMNREIKDKVYKEGETFSYGQVSLKINKSYISNLSNNGKIINDTKTYVILLLEITNRYDINKPFNEENLGLIVNKKRIQPNLIASNYFSDYGTPYNGSDIKGKSTANYILAYEIDKYLTNASFKLEAYSRPSSKNGGLAIINREIKIKPTVINSNITSNSVNKGTKINLNNTNLKNSTVAINDYEITNRFEYQVCKQDDCTKKSISVFDSSSNYNKKFLVLDYNLELDSNSIYSKLNRDYKTFFDDFLEIKYRYNNKDYITKVSLINPENYKDKLIVMVPNTINEASEIYAIITVRNISYQIKLK